MKIGDWVEFYAFGYDLVGKIVAENTYHGLGIDFWRRDIKYTQYVHAVQIRRVLNPAEIALHSMGCIS